MGGVNSCQLIETQFTIFGTKKKEGLFLGVRKKMEEMKYSFHWKPLILRLILIETFCK